MKNCYHIPETTNIKNVSIILSGQPRIPLEKNTVRFIAKNSEYKLSKPLIKVLIESSDFTLYLKNTYQSSVLDTTISVIDDKDILKDNLNEKNKIKTINYDNLDDLIDILNILFVSEGKERKFKVYNFIRFPMVTIPNESVVILLV